MSKTLRITFDTDMAGAHAMFAAVHHNLSPVGLAVFLKTVVDPYLRRRAKQRFASEGDDATGRWLPLTPATVQIRQSMGFPGPHPINHRTGQLERFITDRPGRIGQAAAFSTLTLPGDSPTGELLEKFETAQVGKREGGRGNVTPPRPVLRMNEADMLTVVTELAFYAVGRRER